MRWSSGTINVKSPVELSFIYDPAQCIPGQKLQVKIKAKTKATSGNNNTFASSFGIYLPTKVQLGTVGITGIPDVLPWFNINYDLWDLLGFVPEVGTLLSGIKEQIGINHASKEALPLAKEAKFSDEREVLEVSLADNFSEAEKFDLGKKVCDIFPQKAVTLAVAGIKWAKSMNDSALATGFLYNAVGDKVAGLFNLSLVADPYFKVKGERISVQLEYGVPGRMSGTTTLAFISKDETKTIDIPVPLFTSPGEKVEIKIKSVGYEFKVFQGVGYKVNVSVVTLLDGDSAPPKLVDLIEAKVEPQQDNVVEIPAQVSVGTSPVLDFNIGQGCTSANARWASPAMPLKGTVTVYQGQSNTVVKTVSENAFGISHGVLISDLASNAQYRFHLSCVDQNGATYTVDDLSMTTKTAGACPPRQNKDTATLNDGTTITLTSPQATTTLNSLTLNWNTSAVTSTEAQISLTPDFGTYVYATKKQGGVVAIGYYDSQKGDRASEAIHSLTYPDLSPETTYYYQMISSLFDPSGSVRTTLRYYGSSTTPAPVRPKAQISASLLPQYGPAGQLDLSDIPVGISKSNQDAVFKVVRTDNQGQVYDVVLEAGATYVFLIKGHSAFEDTTATLTVPANSTNTHVVNLALTKRPSAGAYVYDIYGNPVSGATVIVTSPNYYQATTDANGFYAFDKINTPGNVSIKISKADFLDKNLTGKVSPQGIFSIDSCTLYRATATVNFEVKKGDKPIPGALITVSQYGGGLTDNSGKYVFKPLLPSNLANDGVLELNVEVKPPETTGLFTMTDNISLTRGVVINRVIQYQADTLAPYISDVIYKKDSDSQISVSFVTDEKSQHYAQLKGPGGSVLQEIPWSSAYATDHAFVFTAGIKFPDGKFPGGTYKVNVKAKDHDGNTGESGFKDFSFVESYAPGIQALDVKANSVRLSWPHYPFADFGWYDLRVFNQKKNVQVFYERFVIQGISGALTRDVTMLEGSTPYQASVQVFSKTSQQAVGQAATVAFKTLAAPPQIIVFKAGSAVLAMGQKTTLTATVIDSDSDVSEIILKYKDQTKPLFQAEYKTNIIYFSEELAFTRIGSHEVVLVAKDTTGLQAERSLTLEIKDAASPQLKVSGLADNIVLGEQVSAVITCDNMREVRGDVTVVVEWGDGQKSQSTLKAPQAIGEMKEPSPYKVTHKYKEAGNYTITVQGTVKKLGVISEKFTQQVKVTAESAPDVSSGVNEAPPTKDKEPRPGELSEKPASGQISGKPQTGILPGETSAGTAQETQPPDVTVRSLVVPAVIVAGKETLIKFNAANLSAQDAGECLVTVKSDDGLSEERQLRLPAKGKEAMAFKWTPRKEGSQNLIVNIESKEDPKLTNNQIKMKITVKSP